MADWQTPLAALSAAIVPSSSVDALKKAVATVVSGSVISYSGAALDGPGPYPIARAITVTTAPSSTASYKIGQFGQIMVNGLDALGNTVFDQFVLTQAYGGETLVTSVLFTQIIALNVFPQLDTNGSFQFGTLIAPSPSAVAGAQVLIDALAAAGAAYQAEVQSAGARQHYIAPAASVASAASPQIFTGSDANGNAISAYAPIPIQPPSGPVTPNDVFRACRYVALAPGLTTRWPTYSLDGGVTNILSPPFETAEPNGDLARQLDSTWPIVQAFLAPQTSTLPPPVASFLASTLLPLIADGKTWLQYERDMPQTTWTGAPPVATGPQTVEPLPASNLVLIALLAAIADATAYFQYMQAA